jgi:hypothetical protein
MLDASAVEFVARHFENRGGKLYEENSRLAKWATLRTTTAAGESLWQVLQRVSRAMGVQPSAFLDRNEHTNVRKAVYEALSSPTKLRDVAGKATLTFANVSQNFQGDARIPSTDSVTAVEQRAGLTLAWMTQENVDMITPTELLALVTASSSPRVTGTYPPPHTWEWIGGIADDYNVAGAFAHADGLGLGVGDPGISFLDDHVRSVTRERSV